MDSLCRIWSVGLIAALSAAACEQRQPDVLREFPAPRLAVQSRAQRAELRLVPEADARVSVELKARKVSTQLELAHVRGHLLLQPANLRALRGRISVELEALEGQSPGASRRDRTNVASFELQAVLDASVNALHLAPTVRQKSGAEKRAEVTLLVRGLLQLNGYRSEEQARLRLRFPVDHSGPDLRRLELSSSAPMRISLRKFGLQPKLPLGEEGVSGQSQAHYTSAHVSLSVGLLATEE